MASLRRPSEAVPLLQAAADVYQRLAEAAPGTYDRDYVITLDNLSAALADRVDWVAVIRVTEQAIQVWRRLAAETPADELVLARSLASLARAYERTENPAAAALAAATEAIGIYQRLAAASPETTEPLLRDAAQVRDDLLLARDRQLLPPERSRFHLEADSYLALMTSGPAGGVPPPTGIPVTGAIVTGIQHSLSRIAAARPSPGASWQRRMNTCAVILRKTRSVGRGRRGAVPGAVPEHPPDYRNPPSALEIPGPVTGQPGVVRLRRRKARTGRAMGGRRGESVRAFYQPARRRADRRR